jgi:hypothetical protein
MVLDRYGCKILLLTVSQTVQYISTCLQWRFCSFKKKHIHNKFRSIIFISGGTVDITVQEVLHDNNLRELHKASGGAWGGTKVDEQFLQMIVKVVGDKVMQKFKCESKSDELDLLQEFEMKKHVIRPNLNRKICFRIPIALLNAFKEEYHEELTKSIKETYLANSMNLVKGGKLMVNMDMLGKLFSTVSDSIINHLQDILSNPLCRDVDTILMVGGFSECLMIQEALKSSFPQKNVIVPEDAGLAIVKGAVLFGHNPATIVSRKAKYTYGIKTTRDFIEGDPRDKKLNVDGCAKCKDVFDKHVEINQTVKVGEALNSQIYYPLHQNIKEVLVPVYTSTDYNPSYTTETTCDYLGKLVVPLQGPSVKDNAIVVQMTLGGTELEVEAVEKTTKKRLTATFDFLDH